MVVNLYRIRNVGVYKSGILMRNDLCVCVSFSPGIKMEGNWFLLFIKTLMNSIGVVVVKICLKKVKRIAETIVSLVLKAG